MKKWVAQERILSWFWAWNGNDKLAGMTLEADDELVEWCWQHDCNIRGNWIECPNKEAFLMFGMRWT